jgi:nucleoside-diphosphate-sugar epimerase
VPLFVRAIDTGNPIIVYGDGEQRRDFTYVSNAVDGTIKAAEASEANGRIFNVAASSPVTVNAVAAAIGDVLGKPVEKTFAPPRVGDIRDSWADVTAAREVLGWEPTVDLEEGLRKTVDALV